jgi:hypothetical protein
MEDASNLTEKLGSFVAKWTTVAAFGSFLLYLLGYLTLRFQLSTYGLATNLDAFDEKYLFAGCRFLVNVVSSVPSILILVLALAGIGYVPYKLIPPSFRDRTIRWVANWSRAPVRLPLLGTILATAFIQFVLRKCFSLGNLLLQKDLPAEWISSVLLSSNGMLSLYFTGLVAGTFLTAAILWCTLQRGTASTPTARLLVAVLSFVVAVEFLLLPVNYGVLISTQQLPRLVQSSVGDKPVSGEGEWLLWDSKDSLAYFIRTPDDKRMLISVPRKDSVVRIVAYDDIYCVLFSASHANSRPCSR